MQGNRKHVLDKFQEYLNERYHNWRLKHDVEKSDTQLVTFIIDQDLISPIQIQRYTVLGEFDKLCKEEHFQKTQAVNALAHRFSLSERTIWNILKHKKTVGRKKS